MAKLLASEASWEAANACLNTHGGFGFAEEYDVERKFRENRLYIERADPQQPDPRLHRPARPRACRSRTDRPAHRAGESSCRETWFTTDPSNSTNGSRRRRGGSSALPLDSKEHHVLPRYDSSAHCDRARLRAHPVRAHHDARRNHGGVLRGRRIPRPRHVPRRRDHLVHRGDRLPLRHARRHGAFGAADDRPAVRLRRADRPRGRSHHRLLREDGAAGRVAGGRPDRAVHRRVSALPATRRGATCRPSRACASSR